MNTISKDIVEGVVTVTIEADRSEFEEALKRAYEFESDEYIVGDWKEGMAPREELEKAYGSTVLYKEAASLLIDELFGRFCAEEHLTPADVPNAEKVSYGGGTLTFTVTAPVIPAVKLGEYRGIEICGAVKDADEAILDAAAANMDAVLPRVLAERKLDAMLAEEKMRVNADPIYNVLADFTYILDKTYKATGIGRSVAQVKSDALDIMLTTLSGDRKEVSREFFFEELKKAARSYRDIPDDFDKKLDAIVAERAAKKAEMTGDERIDEVFDAYLGSVDMTQEMWRSANACKAERLARRDVMLDAVAEAEGLSADAAEITEAAERLGKSCGMNGASFIEAVGEEMLIWRIKREKAEKLVLESAIIK